MIAAIVPAHDEAEHIGACLRSLRVAASSPLLGGESVTRIVVADDCSDATADIAGVSPAPTSPRAQAASCRCCSPPAAIACCFPTLRPKRSRWRARTSAIGHIEVRQAWLPDEWPHEQVDLIVLSEMGCYLNAASLATLAERVRTSLLPRSTVLACHWRQPIAGCALTGDDVHDSLQRGLALPRMSSYVDDDLRLDVWSLDARSVAELEGSGSTSTSRAGATADASALYWP